MLPAPEMNSILASYDEFRKDKKLDEQMKELSKKENNPPTAAAIVATAVAVKTLTK